MTTQKNDVAGPSQPATPTLEEQNKIKPIKGQIKERVPAGFDMTDEELADTGNIDFQGEQQTGIVTKPFPATVFQQLPNQIKNPCAVLVSATEREVFLVGALGVVSGILPNVFGIYDGKTVHPHLYAYVLAPYGTGKGALTYSGQLGAAIQQALEAVLAENKVTYEAEVAQYEKKMASFKRSNDSQAKPPIKPTDPKNSMLFIPANNSKTGFMQLLDENEQRGILFETEGDTLADALAQDYGNFSDGIRKGFHHEEISYFRRATGRGELVRMKNPKLSIVLSSTEDQLLKLIPSPTNGLFSRFLYYNAPPDPTFRNVFDRRKRSYNAVFEEAGKEFYKIYKQLALRPSDVEVQLTESQEAYFFDHFSATKASIYNDHDESLGGTVNRLGLITFRLCMIFTILRAFEDGIEIPDTLICSDKDFENAIEIVKTLTDHALIVYEHLPKPRQFGASSKYENMKADKSTGISWSQIATKYGYKDKQAAQQWYARQQKRHERQ